MSGFTIVLIDEAEDPSKGDFVYVEAFPTFADLVATEGDSYPEWVDRVVRAAQAIEERGSDDDDS
jgi:hypothetical protein